MIMVNKLKNDAIEKNHCVYHIIAEKYRPEPGVEPRVSCLTYKRVTN